MSDQNELHRLLLAFKTYYAKKTWTVKPDFHIQTRAGVFRVAYNQKQACLALLWARHRDDFSDDPAFGTILHPERLRLIAVVPIDYDPANVILATDKPGSHPKRLRFYLNDIRRIIEETRTIGWRSSVTALGIFRDGPDQFRGRRWSYRFNPSSHTVRLDTALYGIDDLLKPSEVEPYKIQGFKTAWQEVCRRTRRFVYGGISLDLPLPDNAYSPSMSDAERDRFFNVTLPEYVRADHDDRARRLLNRWDPIHMRERALVYVSRFIELLAHNLDSLKKQIIGDPEELARNLFAKAGVMLIGLKPIGAGAGFLSQFWAKCNLPNIPRKFFPMVHKAFRRYRPDPFAADTDRTQRIVPLDAHGLDGFRWLSSQYDSSDLFSEADFTPPTRKMLFDRFLTNHFPSSPAAIFSLIGSGGDYLKVRDLGDAEIIHSAVANGLQFFHMRERNDLYAYFTNPLFPSQQQHFFPCDTRGFLKAGQVLVRRSIVENPDTPFADIPFVEFQREIEGRVGSRFAATLPYPMVPDATLADPSRPGIYIRAVFPPTAEA